MYLRFLYHRVFPKSSTPTTLETSLPSIEPKPRTAPKPPPLPSPHPSSPHLHKLPTSETAQLTQMLCERAQATQSTAASSAPTARATASSKTARSCPCAPAGSSTPSTTTTPPRSTRAGTPGSATRSTRRPHRTPSCSLATAPLRSPAPSPTTRRRGARSRRIAREFFAARLPAFPPCSALFSNWGKDEAMGDGRGGREYALRETPEKVRC